MEDVIGYIAGTLTTICHIPQVFKILRSKNVEGISLMMYGILLTGIFLWLIYGIIIGNLPLIIFNVITAVLTGAIVINVIKHRKRPNA